MVDHSDERSCFQGSRDDPQVSSSPQMSEPSSAAPSTPCSAEPQNAFSSSSSSSASSTPDSSTDASNADSGSHDNWRIPQHDDPYTFLDPDEYFAQARPKRPAATSTPPRRTPRTSGQAAAPTKEDDCVANSPPQFTSPPRYTAQDQSKRTYYYSSYSSNFRRRRQQHQQRDSDGSDSSVYDSDDLDDHEDDYVVFDWTPVKLQALLLSMCHLLGYLLSVALRWSTTSSQWISYLSYFLTTFPSLIGSPVQRTRWTSAAISIFALSKIVSPPIKPHLLGMQASSTLHLWAGSLLWTIVCAAPHALGATSSKQDASSDDDIDDDEACTKQKRKRAKQRAVVLFLLAFGIVWESLADLQQRQFYQNHPATEYSFTGLWNFAQHPDVLGSMCLWTGVWACHVHALIDPSVRLSAQHGFAKRWRRYARRYWRVLAASMLLGVNLGTQWGRISGLLGTLADTMHIHFGYGVDPVYTSFVDTTPLLWGSTPFDSQKHRQNLNKKKGQKNQYRKDKAAKAKTAGSTKAKARKPGGTLVKGSSAKSSDTKNVPRTRTEPVPSLSNPDDHAPHSKRPLDEIVRWYAILEERHQEFDWGHVALVEDAADSPIPTASLESRPPSLRAGRQMMSPVSERGAPLEPKSTAEATADELNNLQGNGDESSSQDDEAEDWKQKILELVQKSKRLLGKNDLQSEEFPTTQAATLDVVRSTSHQHLPPPKTVDPQSNGQPPATCDSDSRTDLSESIGASLLSTVDSGLVEEYATVCVGEQGSGCIHSAESTVDFRTVDAYETSLREAMETFEAVVRSVTNTRAVPESTNVKPNEVMSHGQGAHTSPLSSEKEMHVQPKLEAAPLFSGEAPESSSPSGPQGGIRIGLSRYAGSNGELDAIAAKLVAESVAMKDSRKSGQTVSLEAKSSQTALKPATPLPHTRMGASRLRLTAQVNHLLTKYVISADESFEEFVARHQKAIKHEVLQHSSRLSSTLLALWNVRSAAWLEPLRVARLHDLWLLDDDEDTEGAADQDSPFSAKSRRRWERLRVSRLRELWNVDLDAEMNVIEEPPQRNPFEPLRVDRLRELWLDDSF